MREFGIDNSALANVVKKYKDFLGNKERRNKLKSYDIKKWNENTIHIAVLCAVCKLDVIDFENALMTIFADYAYGGTLLDDVKKYCDMETLDKFIENKFGIANGFEDVDNMITNILLLHTSLYLKGTLPASWKTNLPDTNNFAIKNNAYIFVDRFMKSDLSEAYILLSDRVAEKINFERVTKDWDIESYEDVNKILVDKQMAPGYEKFLNDLKCNFSKFLAKMKRRFVKWKEH